MSRIDASIHKLYRAMKANDIKWNDFPSIGLCESYYLWYYAEDRLYMIKDCMTDMIYLVEARSLTEAFKHLVARLNEAAIHAGEMVDEEVTE